MSNSVSNIKPSMGNVGISNFTPSYAASSGVIEKINTNINPANTCEIESINLNNDVVDVVECYDNLVEEYGVDFVNDKFINTGLWQGTKWWIKDFFDDSLPGLVLVALLEGTYKITLEGVSEGGNPNFQDISSTFTSGFVKSLGSGSLKKIDKILSKSELSTIFKRINLEEVPGFKDLETYWKIVGKASGISDDVVKKITDNTFKQLSSFGMTFGIDFFSSLLANYASAKVSGKEINFETLKLGESFLKSVTKNIGLTVGKIVGGAMFPGAGEKVGGIVGTVIGATVSEFQVKSLGGDESWCAIAGGSELIGALGVGALAVAGIATGVVVVGALGGALVIGGAIATGAVAGFGITKFCYDLAPAMSYINSEIRETGADNVLEFMFGW